MFSFRKQVVSVLFVLTFNQIESLSPKEGSKHQDLQKKKQIATSGLDDVAKKEIPHSFINTNPIHNLNRFISTQLKIN